MVYIRKINNDIHEVILINCKKYYDWMVLNIGNVIYYIKFGKICVKKLQKNLIILWLANKVNI